MQYKKQFDTRIRKKDTNNLILLKDVSTIRGLENKKIERHNGTSKTTHVIALHINSSHRDKNNVVSPRNLKMLTNYISKI